MKRCFIVFIAVFALTSSSFAIQDGSTTDEPTTSDNFASTTDEPYYETTGTATVPADASASESDSCGDDSALQDKNNKNLFAYGILGSLIDLAIFSGLTYHATGEEGLPGKSGLALLAFLVAPAVNLVYTGLVLDKQGNAHDAFTSLQVATLVHASISVLAGFGCGICAVCSAVGSRVGGSNAMAATTCGESFFGWFAGALGIWGIVAGALANIPDCEDYTV